MNTEQRKDREKHTEQRASSAIRKGQRDAHRQESKHCHEERTERRTQSRELALPSGKDRETHTEQRASTSIRKGQSDAHRAES